MPKKSEALAIFEKYFSQWKSDPTRWRTVIIMNLLMLQLWKV